MEHKDLYINKSQANVCSLKRTNMWYKSQIRHHNQTKSKKPPYVESKIICKLRIINTHERRIMENWAKVVGLHKSKSCIFQSQNIHIGLSSNIWWAWHTHKQNTPKYIYINSILSQAQKLILSIARNLFYFLFFYAKMVDKTNSKQSSNSKHDPVVGKKTEIRLSTIKC